MAGSWLHERTEWVSLGDGGRMAANPWPIRVPASVSGWINTKPSAQRTDLPYYSSQQTPLTV